MTLGRSKGKNNVKKNVKSVVLKGVNLLVLVPALVIYFYLFGVLSMLVNYCFQVSFNLKVKLYLAKIS